jgi:plasmid stabilization system protein ParE
MNRIVIRPRAAADIEDCAIYLLPRSLDAAIRFADAVAADFEKLAAMPGMGAIRDFAHPAYAGLRSWPVGDGLQGSGDAGFQD